jgi:hypothetical protein
LGLGITAFVRLIDPLSEWMLCYPNGLLGNVERKNGWQMAEALYEGGSQVCWLDANPFENPTSQSIGDSGVCGNEKGAQAPFSFFRKPPIACDMQRRNFERMGQSATTAVR